MEILQSTAKMQQSQMGVNKTEQAVPTRSIQEMEKADINQEKLVQNEPNSKTEKIGSQEQMDQLVKQLNHSLEPLNTSLRFGFDNKSDVFYVSVIDTKSERIIRRFPQEQAEQLLPKMQAAEGALFDDKG
ncbi:MAG: flagellar protein FlaG [Campylobacterales bacterium]|nr:flagellar protein FlaG [Campylobacterales bacterium]